MARGLTLSLACSLAHENLRDKFDILFNVLTVYSIMSKYKVQGGELYQLQQPAAVLDLVSPIIGQEPVMEVPLPSQGELLPYSSDDGRRELRALGVHIKHSQLANHRALLGPL